MSERQKIDWPAVFEGRQKLFYQNHKSPLIDWHQFSSGVLGCIFSNWMDAEEGPISYPIWFKNVAEAEKYCAFIPTKREGWVNISTATAFTNGKLSGIVSHAFKTKEDADADNDRWKDRIACVRIEWEE